MLLIACLFIAVIFVSLAGGLIYLEYHLILRFGGWGLAVFMIALLTVLCYLTAIAEGIKL